MKTNSIVLKARIALLPLLILIALSSFAAAQKCTWNLTGDWTIDQYNGIKVKLTLRQTGTKVRGTASYQGTKQGHAHMEFGKVKGVFEENENGTFSFLVDIKWEYGETGIYRGQLKRTKRNGFNDRYMLMGNAYIAEDSGNSARKTDWETAEAIPCVPKK